MKPGSTVVNLEKSLPSSRQRLKHECQTHFSAIRTASAAGLSVLRVPLHLTTRQDSRTRRKGRRQSEEDATEK